MAVQTMLRHQDAHIAMSTKNEILVVEENIVGVSVLTRNCH